MKKKECNCDKLKKGKKLYVVIDSNGDLIGIWGTISEAVYFSFDILGIDFPSHTNAHRKYYQQICDDLRESTQVYIPRGVSKEQQHVRIELHHYSREYIFQNEANLKLYQVFQNFNKKKK